MKCPQRAGSASGAAAAPGSPPSPAAGSPTGLPWAMAQSLSGKPDLSGATPDKYCQGFSSASCALITQMVNAKTRPSFCNKPDWAMVGSGLTLEQTRACWVIVGKETQAPPVLVEASLAPPPPTRLGETIIGQWSGKGNGKSRPFKVPPGPWELG
jgi:hypothetical protein